MDFVLPKPPSVRGYALHRVATGLTQGEKVLFADCGDPLHLRTDKPLELAAQTVRTVRAGDIVGFELRACVGSKIKGKHRYFHTADWRSRHQWLERQGERHGFTIITVHCTAQMLPVEAGTRRFTVDQTDFTGVLKVTDANKFSAAVTHGIGNKAKAFGFGMLII